MCKELSIEDVTFHSLRHTSASLKLRVSGGNYKSVQADTGHATTQMLLDRYGHVFEEDRITNAQRVGDVLFAEQTEEASDIDALVKAVKSNPELLSRLLSEVKSEGAE